MLCRCGSRRSTCIGPAGRTFPFATGSLGGRPSAKLTWHRSTCILIAGLSSCSLVIWLWPKMAFQRREIFLNMDGRPVVAVICSLRSDCCTSYGIPYASRICPRLRGVQQHRHDETGSLGEKDEEDAVLPDVRLRDHDWGRQTFDTEIYKWKWKLCYITNLPVCRFLSGAWIRFFPLRPRDAPPKQWNNWNIT